MILPGFEYLPAADDVPGCADGAEVPPSVLYAQNCCAENVKPAPVIVQMLAEFSEHGSDHATRLLNQNAHAPVAATPQALPGLGFGVCAPHRKRAQQQGLQGGVRVVLRAKQ